MLVAEHPPELARIDLAGHGLHMRHELEPLFGTTSTSAPVSPVNTSTGGKTSMPGPAAQLGRGWCSGSAFLTSTTSKVILDGTFEVWQRRLQRSEPSVTWRWS